MRDAYIWIRIFWASFIVTILMRACSLQEGPTCVINEEEFFDAVDASLDKLEGDYEVQMERTKEKINNTIVKHTPMADTPGAVLSLPDSHRLHEEVSVSSIVYCLVMMVMVLNLCQTYGQDLWKL